MTEPRASRWRAVLAAEAILEQFGVSSLPVDIEAIADELGIPVSSQELPLNIFGATAHDGLKARILISTACFSPGHRRFTLAHEIGHCCIDGHAEELISRGRALHYSESSVSTRRDPVEVEADAFAAALLMPAELTKSVALQQPPGLGMVRAIASAAGVSLTAAAIRACELIPDPFAVVLSYRATVQWASFSGGMRDHRWTRRSFKNDGAPPDSATMRLTKSLRALEEREGESDTAQLSDWFAGAPNVWTAEEALGLGKHGGVLTVLVPEGLPMAEAVEHQRREAERSPKDWRDALRTYRWDDPNALDS